MVFLNDAPSLSEEEENTLLQQFAEIVASIEERKKPIEAEYAAFIAKKNQLLNELNVLREDIIMKVNTIIASARDEIQDAFQSSEDLFNVDLEKISIIMTAADCAKVKSNFGQDKTKEQALVDLKLGYLRLDAVKDMVNNLKLSQSEKVPPSLFIGNDIEILTKTGIVRKSNRTKTPRNEWRTITKKKEIKVDFPVRSVSSDITGICMLLDKTILVCDYNNKQVRRIERNKLISSWHLNFNPFDACVISETEIAVTVPKLSQVVTMSAYECRKLRSFKTDKPCKGVDSNGESIFTVSSSWHDNSPGSLYQFSKRGLIIREFGLIQEFSLPLSPVRVCLDNQGLPLFTDPKHGLFRLESDGSISHVYQDTEVTGVCVTNHDQILICTVCSDSVLAISNDGEVMSTIKLSNSDWHVSLAYEKDSSTIAIGCLNSRSIHLVGLEC